MVILSIVIISLLWIYSLVAFAKWRHAGAIAKNHSVNLNTDLGYQLYLKLSGLAVLVWIYWMLAGSA